MARLATLSLQEVADELGVHYMTAYRYVRTGRLSAHKDGGIWKITPSDLKSFCDTPRLTPGRGGSDLQAHTQRLKKTLITADESGSWQVIQEAIAGGCGIEELYIDVVGGAIAAVGSGWAAGELTVADEHKATEIVLRLFGRLQTGQKRRGQRRGTIVVGCPPNDDHSLAAALVSDLLRLRHFNVVNLGPKTPAESFVEVANSTDRLVAVVIPMLGPDSVAGLSEVVTGLKALEVVAPVVVGGWAVEGCDASTLEVDHVASSIPHGLELIEALTSL